MGTRMQFDDKLGGTVYAFTMHGKVKRATIPIKRSTKGLHIFMISFDTNVNQEPIILKKILPLLDELVL